MNIKRQIFLLLLAQFLIIASLDMTDPYWPLIIQHHHHYISPRHLQYWSAAIYMAPFLVTIFTLPFWSYLGNQFGHKKMILRAAGVLVLTQLLLGFVTEPLLILGVRLIQGFFAGFTASAQAWLLMSTSINKHSRIIGRMQATTAVGTIVGPILGGWIAHYFGYREIFISSATICFCVVLLLIRHLSETPLSAAKHRLFSIKSFHHLTPTILFLLVLICVTQAARWMSMPFFALYVVQHLQGNNLTVGMLYAATALCTFGAALLWGGVLDQTIKQAPLRIKWYFAGNFLLAMTSQYLFAISTRIQLALMAALLWGLSLGAIGTLSFAVLMHYIKDKHKSSIVGFSNSASKLGNLVGIGVGAVIQAEGNFITSFLAIAIFYLLIGIVLFFSANDKFYHQLSH